MLEQRPEFQVVGKAFDGLEAVQKAQELQPDLILLDIGLPKLNGIEVARRVRTLVPNVKILFVSQESAYDVAKEALGLGMGYVLKVRAGSELLPAIEAVLAGKRFVSSGLGFDDRTRALAPRNHELLTALFQGIAYQGARTVK